MGVVVGRRHRHFRYPHTEFSAPPLANVGCFNSRLYYCEESCCNKRAEKDYVNEIQQRYELGFTPYQLQTSVYNRVYNGTVYVLDDVATLKVTARNIATGDNSKLIYFVKADDGSGVALQGDQGPSGVRGLKGDTGGQGTNGGKIQLESVAL